MKILIAPSEKKSGGGDKKVEFFSFPELNGTRKEVIERYNKFILETEDEKNFGKDKTPIEKRPAKEAILRYRGVAFDYLDYESLDNSSKNYLNENLIIFSNLFGVVKPLDLIPFYTLKQGAKPGFDIYKFYKPFIEEVLNKDEEYVDLRAKFYEKMFKPKKSVSFKFIKNGKVVSHFAKAYRGTLARNIALNKPKNLDELLEMEFPGIKAVDTIEKGGVKEIICEIL